MTTTTKADTEVMAATATTRADTAVDKADHAVDKAADLLQDFANKAAAEGGLVAKIAPELAEDAAFLRKLKPSLIMARAKGRAPKNQKPAEGVVAPAPEASSRPTSPWAPPTRSPRDSTRAWKCGTTTLSSWLPRGITNTNSPPCTPVPWCPMPANPGG